MITFIQMNTSSSLSKIPRIESLHHRLKSAKGPEREPRPVLDELMVFLEDPPAEVRDRWQAGADFCEAQGFPTSRMAVWRLYRAHVLAWRREQAPEVDEISETSTAELLEQARHLVALRAVESLQHPCLPPHVLVGLVQNENRRQEILLARDKFNDQIEVRHMAEHRLYVQRADQEAYEQARARFPVQPMAYPGMVEAIQQAAAIEKEARANRPAPVAPSKS